MSCPPAPVSGRTIGEDVKKPRPQKGAGLSIKGWVARLLGVEAFDRLLFQITRHLLVVGEGFGVKTAATGY